MGGQTIAKIVFFATITNIICYHPVLKSWKILLGNVAVKVNFWGGDIAFILW